MQTFLPLPSFKESAVVLDRSRLGKQRVECKQVLNALIVGAGGWANHPATKMWRGFEPALCHYAIEICKEWRARGYKDSLLEFFENILIPFGWSPLDLGAGRRLHLPPWFGESRFHASHRSNLLRKDAGWYGQFGWIESPDLPYIWPV